MNSRNYTGLFVILLPIMVCLGAPALIGAAPKASEKLVIPDYPTSKDQYMFASMYEQNQITGSNIKQRKEQLGKVAQCYERVVNRFPEDQTFTPRAVLELGDCAAQSSDFNKAKSLYNSAMQNYPDDEYIQARAMCAVGLIQDLEKDHEGAKATYKEIMDRYGNSRSGAVREIVKRASTLYFKVHEVKAEKKHFTVKSLNPFSKKEE